MCIIELLCTVLLLYWYVTVLYGTVLYCTVLYCTVLYCTVLYCTGIVLYCTVLYCTVLYCTGIVLYCTVLYCIQNGVKNAKMDAKIERKPTALSNIRWRSHWFGTLPYLCIYCDFFLYFFKKK